jgi:hypothetical protein
VRRCTHTPCRPGRVIRGHLERPMDGMSSGEREQRRHSRKRYNATKRLFVVDSSARRLARDAPIQFDFIRLAAWPPAILVLLHCGPDGGGRLSPSAGTMFSTARGNCHQRLSLVATPGGMGQLGLSHRLKGVGQWCSRYEICRAKGGAWGWRRLREDKRGISTYEGRERIRKGGPLRDRQQRLPQPPGLLGMDAGSGLARGLFHFSCWTDRSLCKEGAFAPYLLGQVSLRLQNYSG